MKHVVSDEEDARSILYHRRMGKEEELVRFKVAAHGATGEDFIAGDAKPLQSGTEDYVCKYRVVAADAGKGVAIMIGKASVDVEGNPLAAFYRHPVKLQVKPTAAAPEQREQESDATPAPTAPESSETTPLTIVSITHYRDGSDIPIAEGERVPLGTTLLTEIVFSASVRVDDTLQITYTTNKGEKKYLASESGIHWRGTCRPGKRENSVLCKAAVDVDPFIVRVDAASDLEGNSLGAPVTASEIDVDAIHLSSNRIDENQPIGSVVGTFRVPVGKRLSYSLVEGTRDFTIADGTKLVTNRVFNYEMQWGYKITVRETDGETNESLEKPYTIFINDLNEAPTDLRLTNNTFYRADGIGTKIGQLRIIDEDREDEEHQVRITQGDAYVGYDDDYLHVLQLFDRATKEIAVEVTDPAGLVYTEIFEITMEERPTQPSEPSDPPSSSQDDEPSEPTKSPEPPGRPPDDFI